jgi:hypothetical protein
MSAAQQKGMSSMQLLDLEENIAKIDPDTLSVSEAFNTLQKFARESTELLEYRKAIK